MLPKYKEIVDLIKKGATVEAQEKIMELREAALELQEENTEIKTRIKELEKQLEIKEFIEFSGSVYWLWKEDDAGDHTIKDGPFCQLCYDSNNKLIRLQNWNDALHCMNCENTFDS